MLTRCPHCETAFRVTPEQLKARNGLARCGSCHGVFNALDSLTDEGTIVIGHPHPPVEEPRKAEAVPPVEVETLAEAETRYAPEMSVDLEPIFVEIEPEPAREIEVQTEAEVETEPQIEAQTESMPVAEIGAEAASVAEEIDFALLPEDPVNDDESKSRLRQDGNPLPETETQTDGLPESPQELPTKPQEPPATTPEPEEESFPEAWSTVTAPPAPPRRWPWITGVLLLLVLMVGQLLYVFRIELAVMLPEVRPALVAACDQLGCVLPLPRKPEMLGIETSDLAPADGDRLLFTATLKNRAPFGQEYPHLELTLTDTRDAAMVRKVLTPAEYLPAGQSVEAGFAARSEIAVKLTLEALGVPAVGYRLYLFYP